MTRQKDYTTKEVAALLGISSGRVRQYCVKHPQLGVLRARTRLFSPADVAELKRIRKRNKTGVVDPRN